ncbi:MAG: YDG domain-containing protein, partial [Sulfuritalea sp.]|nr:YDG domain-containing protein [Sulfuritalea sp.]
MNHAYRTVFNAALGTWVAVPETARAKGKGGKAKLVSAAVLSALTFSAHALPTGGQVSAGTGTVSESGSTMTVNQTSQNLAINWQSFNVGAGETANFVQPNASAIALNRVLGVDGSSILGKLNANGQVWILNPNGVLFGKSAQVNVGGLVASTLGLSDADFMGGKRTFSGAGGKVTNQGEINAAYVALLGEQVKNEGVIVANLGTVALAAGNQVTLDFAGDRLLNVQVDEGALHALTENKNLIQADGGLVVMTAKAKDALLDTAVNNSGVIRARTIENSQGRILLLGDMQHGTVNVGGTLDASAPNTGNGGFIETSAHNVLLNTPAVTASALYGKGGTWLIDPTDVLMDAAYNAPIVVSLNAGTNVTVTTVAAGAQPGDITVASSIAKTAGGAATLTLQAHNNIVVNNGVSISSTVGALNVVLNSDADASGAGNIQMGAGSGITSNGGNITLGGGLNPLTTAAVGTGAGLGLYGVYLNNAALSAGAGNISLTGTGVGGTTNAYGIYALGATTIATTSGNITLNGTGGAGTVDNYGVYLTDAGTNISSASGAISITGQGAGSGTDNYGIFLDFGAALTSTGTATITLDGSGGAGTRRNHGVYLVDAGTNISSASGAISITGQGAGSGTDNYGIALEYGAAVTSTGTATITLDGTGGAGTDGNYGVFLVDAGTNLSSATGAISITGQGAGSGIDNNGIRMSSAAAVTSTGTATITIDGTGGAGTDDNYGVYLTDLDTNISSANGAISIAGQGAGSGTNNYGIALEYDAAITSTGSANITLDGRGAGTAQGIYTNIGTNIIGGAADTGNITLIADSASGADSLSLANLILQSTGNLLLQPLNAATTIGLAGGAGAFNLDAAELGFIQDGFANLTIGRANGTGAITTGAWTPPASANLTLQNPGAASGGIAINGALTLGALKNLTLNSTGAVTQTAAITAAGLELLGAGGAYTLTNAGNAITTLAGNTGTVSLVENSGFAIGTVNTAGLTTSGNTTLNSTGAVTQTAAITAAGLELLGAGGAYTLTNAGNLITTLAANTGSINVTNNQALRVGTVYTAGSITTTGDLTLTATGAGADDNAHGLLLYATTLNAGAGNISLTGTGVAGTTDALGIYVISGTTITTTSGNITLNGTGGAGSWFNCGVYLDGTIGPNTKISSATGAISITGQGAGSGTDNYGIVLSGGVVVTSTGSANITLDGRGAGTAQGIYTNIGTNIIGGASDTGNITLIADSASGADSLFLSNLAIQSTGNLLLQPLNAATTIGLAGGAGTFNLDATELSSIQNGFANITIGRANGTGAITTGAWTPPALANLSLQNPGVGSGGIAIDGALTLGAGKNLTLNSTGAVTQTAAITAAGLELLGAGGAYTLTNAGNAITTLAGDTGSINLTNNGSFTVGTVTGASTTGITATGDITLVGSDIALSAPINWSSGTLAINASGTITNTAAINGSGTAIFNLHGGTWNQIAASLPGFAAHDFRISGGTFIRALSGDGTVGTPYQLADIYGVQGMRSSGMLGKNYQLANNIDATGTVNWNGNLGFTPVGDSVTSFTGVFDGLVHTIDGLTINRPSTEYVGLFGNASGATLQNVGLTNAAIVGFNRVGALVGTLNGTVSNSYASGTVTAPYNVGGLVGYADGSSVATSYAEGNVSGAANVGGLIGYTVNGLTITDSHATGAVTGSAGQVGGLVGFANGSVSVATSYAEGNVTGGASNIGGLIGYTVNGLTITDSHATGAVTGSGGQVGGLVGFANGSGSVATSYAVGNVTGYNNVGGLIGYTAVGLTITDSHATGAVTGSAGQAGGLVGFANTSSVTNSYAEGDVHLTGGTNAGGLIGYATTGASVSGSHASGAVSGIDYTGGLIGSTWNGASISDSYATGLVSGGAYVGGLIGYTETNITITNSHASGNVTGTGSVGNIGGLLGGASGVTLTNGYATGTVTGTDWVGGLVGWGFDSTISASYATGQTSGGSWVGGLAGGTKNLTLSGSYASGAVVGTGSYVGGLVGRLWYSSLADSYATGNVQGGIDVGGLVGWLRDATSSVNNSYATGAVTGTTNVGGLVGLNLGTVSNSFWNTTATGTGVGSNTGTFNAVGLASADMHNLSNYSGAGWNIDDAAGTGKVWRIYDGKTNPLLRSFLTTLSITANDASKDYDGLAYSGGNGVVYSTAPNMANLFDAASYGGASQGAINAGSYAIAPAAYSNQQGHDIAYVNGTLTVAPIELLVVSGSFTAANKVYDGTAAATITSNSLTLSGLIGADTVTPNWAASFVSSADYSSPESRVGNNRWVALNGTTLGGASGGNYFINPLWAPMTHANITPKAIGLTGLAAANKVYDGSNAATLASNGAFTGLVGSESLTLTGPTSADFADSNAATGIAVNIAGLGIANGTGLASNYLFTQTSATLTADITPLPITMTGSVAANKSYDGTTTATVTPGNILTICIPGSGCWNGRNQLGVSASGVFTDQNAGNGKNVSTSYTLSDIGSLIPGNYSVVDQTLTANITPAPLTITANAVSKTYDGTTGAAGTAALTAGTLFGADAFSGGTFAFANKNAGTGKTVSVSGITLNDGNGGANYTVTYADNAASTINKADLTVSTGNITKTYDSTTSAAGAAAVTAGTLFTGDTLTGGTFAFADKNAGTGKTVTASGITLNDGNGGNNYNVTLADNTTSTIDKADVSISGLAAANKTYDGTVAASLVGPAMITALGSDDVTVSGTASGVFADKNAGTGKAITVSGLTLGGADAGNYNVPAQPAGLTADITQANLTVSTGNVTKTYDGTTSAAGTAAVAAGTLFGGDVISGGTYAFADKNAGIGKTVTVSGITLNDGNGGGNYNVAYADNTTSTIDKANATVTANSGATTYTGLAQSVSGFTASGLVNGEAASVLTGVTAGGSGTNAGSYATTASGTDGNYILSFVNGALTINKANATVTANGGTTTYTGQAQSVSGFTASGLVNGEAASVLTGVTATGATGTNAGSYATIASGTDGNYNLSFVNGSLTISKADATVTASSGTTTYNGQQQSVSGFTASGLVNSETENVLTGVTAGGSGTNAGSYATIASGTDGNYNLSFVNGSLTISKANATVTANSGTSTYNGQQQSVSGFTASGLVNSESENVLTGVTAGGSGTNAGSYATIASGTDGNYNLSFVNGSL